MGRQSSHGRTVGLSCTIIIIIVIMFMALSCRVHGYGVEEEEEEGKGRVELEKEKKKPSVSEMIGSVFSLYTTSPITTSYYHKLKSMVTQAYTYVFPPNIDFRGTKEGAEEEATGGGGKVKEAVSKSMEKTKETLEDSAKSAAEIASKTMQKTKEKVKKTLSEKREPEL